ncbi:unnamed protein product, partial [Acanthoscelides obtectus]
CRLLTTCWRAPLIVSSFSPNNQPRLQKFSNKGKMASRAQKILNLVRQQEKTKSALEKLDNTVQTDSQTVVPAVPSTLPERYDEHISTFNGFDINSMEIVLADDVLEIDEAEFNLPPAELGINVCGLEDKDLDLRHIVIKIIQPLEVMAILVAVVMKAILTVIPFQIMSMQ